MPKLKIHLFGNFQVLVDQQPVTGFRSNKVRALLAYLLTENSAPVLRTELSRLLWDGYTLQSAQTSLRSALRNLRQLFAPFDLLEITRHTVQVKVDPAVVWCDVIAFQQAWQNRTHLDYQTWQALSVQAAFLYDLPPIDSAPFQQWLTTCRATYRQQREQLRQELRSRHYPVRTMPLTNKRFYLNVPTTSALPPSVLTSGVLTAHSTKREIGVAQPAAVAALTNLMRPEQQINVFTPSPPLLW